MRVPNSHSNLKQIVEVQAIDRWMIYYRLQELEVKCHCSCNQPLEVELKSPLEAIQLWSVARQYKEHRQSLVNFIANCWELDSSKNKNPQEN